MFYVKKTLTGYKQVDYEECECICMDLYEFRTKFIDICTYNGLVNNYETALNTNKNYNLRYDELQNKYEMLQNQFKNADIGQISNELDNIKAENADYINRISYLEQDMENLKEKNEKLESDLAEKNKKLNDLKNKYNDLLYNAKYVYEENTAKENSIRNLMRINKQRTNAMRGLTPKTTHTGYVVNSVQEFQQVLSTYRGKITSSRRCWKVYIQTPYMIQDGITSKNIDEMLALLHIRNQTTPDQVNSWGNENVAFNIMRNDNYKQGFIEFSLCCTEYPRVTDDMLPPEIKKSKEK